MKQVSMNTQPVNSPRFECDENFENVNMGIPKSVYLFEDDFIEIDVPIDEMTMR